VIHIADRAPANRDAVHVQPMESMNEAKHLQDNALKRVTTWRRRRRLTPRRGLGFRPKIMARARLAGRRWRRLWTSWSFMEVPPWSSRLTKILM
jgi:hypothetical protein